jgi:4-aminobutyrate aminotransferase-like enzyme
MINTRTYTHTHTRIHARIHTCICRTDPYCHRCPQGGGVNGARGGCGGVDFGGCCGEPERQLHLLLKQQTAPAETAALILEPVLGEGGCKYMRV